MDVEQELEVEEPKTKAPTKKGSKAKREQRAVNDEPVARRTRKRKRKDWQGILKLGKKRG